MSSVPTTRLGSDEGTTVAFEIDDGTVKLSLKTDSVELFEGIVAAQRRTNQTVGAIRSRQPPGTPHALSRDRRVDPRGTAVPVDGGNQIPEYELPKISTYLV